MGTARTGGGRRSTCGASGAQQGTNSAPARVTPTAPWAAVRRHAQTSGSTAAPAQQELRCAMPCCAGARRKRRSIWPQRALCRGAWRGRSQVGRARLRFGRHVRDRTRTRICAGTRGWREQQDHRCRQRGRGSVRRSRGMAWCASLPPLAARRRGAAESSLPPVPDRRW
jgi:hypothetical protein